MIAGLCPCFSSKPYTECCAPYHTKKQGAPTPLALMRSRFSAYVLGLVDYIMDTTDRQGSCYEQNLIEWRLGIRSFCSSTAFLGLTIHSSKQKGSWGSVLFTAHLEREGRDVSFQEHSRFRFVGRKWIYVDAQGCLVE